MEKYLNNFEVLKIAGKKSKVLMYSELQNYRDIGSLFANGIDKIILLYRQTFDSGHWVSLTLNRKKKLVTVFDSYGIMIDDELDWNSDEKNRNLKQEINYLTHLLSDYDGKIEYNEVQLQSKDRNVATCGRWCGYWCRASEFMSLETFQKKFLKMKKLNLNLDEVIVDLTNKYLN